MLTNETEAALNGLLETIDQAIITTRPRYLSHFNEWFAAPDVVSAYVRYVDRALPRDFFVTISDPRDTRPRESRYNHVRIQMLELSNFSVNRVVRRQGVAKALIAGLSKLAHDHGLYFMVENVAHPGLIDHLLAQEVFVPLESGLGGCLSFYRKWESTPSEN